MFLSFSLLFFRELLHTSHIGIVLHLERGVCRMDGSQMGEVDYGSLDTTVVGLQ